MDVYFIGLFNLMLLEDIGGMVTGLSEGKEHSPLLELLPQPLGNFKKKIKCDEIPIFLHVFFIVV